MIPKSFTLLGHNITVKIDNEKLESLGYQGLYDPVTHTIYIADKYKSPKGRWMKYKEDVVWHTYYHELVHCILYHMNEMTLYGNERFVDNFGGLLHQYDNTKKYDR